jgi:hypothetical protein
MTTLIPARKGAATDLAIFAQRVAKFDPEAVMRIVAAGRVAGCFAETPFEVLALRAVELAEPVGEGAETDVVVEAANLAAKAVGARGELELPVGVSPLRWTSSLPPRAGFDERARLPLADVAQRVERSIAEFKHRAPDVTGGLALREGRTALEGLAAELWDDELAAGVPLRLAHAAHSYGFLAGQGEVVLREVGRWQRLDAPNGIIVARQGLTLFAM